MFSNPSLINWAMFSVLRAFEAVADDIAVLVDHAAVVQGVDDVNVVSG